jgi:hypothetical protein
MRAVCSTMLLAVALAALGCAGGDRPSRGATPPPARVEERAGPKTGRVEIGNAFVGQGAREGVNGSVDARFHASGPCAKTWYETCYVSSCPGDEPANGASAGTISIGGLAVPIRLERQDGARYQAIHGRQLFSGGEVITVSSSGAEVPAFHATLEAPPQPTLTHPPISDSHAIVNGSKSADWSLAWTGGGAGIVRVSLQSRSTSVTCDFKASDGEARVPRAALARMDHTALVAVSAIETATVSAGDWSVAVVVRTDARLPNGHTAAAYLALP